MKLNKEQIRGSHVEADEIKRQGSAMDVSDEEQLQIESNIDEDDGSEYEYVPISQASQGVISKIVSFLREYALIAFFIGISILCLVLSRLGSQMGAIFIAIAFGFIAIAVAYLLYDAWQNKKAADAAYRHALDVREPVKRKMARSEDD